MEGHKESFKNKYIKYKNRFLKLKLYSEIENNVNSISTKNKFNKKIIESIFNSVNIVSNNIDKFKKYINLPYEVGGYFDLINNTFLHTASGTVESQTLDSLDIFTLNVNNRIDWHTHSSIYKPQIFTDKNFTTKENYKGKWINASPSSTDYQTNANASFYAYEEIPKDMVISCVISKYGLYFYWIQQKMLEFINSEKENKDIIINEYLIDNLNNDTMKGMNHTDGYEIQEIQRLTRKSFNEEMGFDSVFIPIEKIEIKID